MDQLIDSLRTSWLGEAMRQTDNLFPAMEMAHFVGLSLLMGAMIVIDLRLLGVWRGLGYSVVLRLLPIAIAGFVINLASGIAFIAANPPLYLTNPAFYVKLGLIALGGLNALWFTLEQKHVTSLPADAPAPAPVKIAAAASLVVWFAVIVLGRLLPTFAPVAGG